MKQKLSNIVLTVISVLFMCGIVVLAVMYAEGYYDFSFIDRSTEPEVTQQPPEDTEPDTTQAVETSPVTTEAPSVETDAETEPVSQAYDFGALHASFENYSSYPDRIPTENIYNPSEHKLLRLTGLDLPDALYTGKYRVTSTSITYDKYLRVYSESVSEYSRPSADVYMGMLVIANGNILSFYSGDGELLCRYENPVIEDGAETGETTDTAAAVTDGAEPDEGDEAEETAPDTELVYAYERDADGNPLFTIDGEYYIIDEESKTLVPSDYDPRDSRGLKYNYISTFGVYEGQFTAFRSGKLFGIYKTDGERLKRAIYQEGYNYSEGLGYVVYDGEMCYLNEKGKVAVEGYYKVGAKNHNAIGAIYYDGGYVRVRKIKTDIRGNVIQDSDTLVDKEGKEIVLPAGYTFVSYSNQRVLVSKSFKYGFYAIKGAWVADAVYAYATPYYEGLAVVGTSDGRRGVIDMEGSFVIPLSYTSISVCSGGITVCYSQETGYDVYVKTEAHAPVTEETQITE